MSKDGFAARAQSAGDRNANTTSTSQSDANQSTSGQGGKALGENAGNAGGEAAKR